MPDRHGLAYGRRYTYAALVEDTEGRLSPPSARLSVTYFAPPAPPEQLQATAGEATKMMLALAAGSASGAELTTRVRSRE